MEQENMNETRVQSLKILGLDMWKASKYYLMWILFHWLTINAYSYYCSGSDLWSLITTPFMSMLPQCRAMIWVLEKSFIIMENMWIIFGTWLIGKLSYTALMHKSS